MSDHHVTNKVHRDCVPNALERIETVTFGLSDVPRIASGDRFLKRILAVTSPFTGPKSRSSGKG